jgi:hypothetical protein
VEGNSRRSLASTSTSGTVVANSRFGSTGGILHLRSTGEPAAATVDVRRQAAGATSDTVAGAVLAPSQR